MNVVNDVPTTSDVAHQLLESGWSPLPIPARSKGAPPTGFTGYNGRYVTAADVERWTWDGNIAIRLPPDVVGVDVDVYHGGDRGLIELQERYGVLPVTVWSTSREDGSGIALYRVPAGTTLATDPAQGIDMIQAHHRYMVVWPSIHPEGRVYQWIDEQDQSTYLDGPPEPADLPELPWAWIEGLTVDKGTAARAATPDEVRSFVAEQQRQTKPAALRGVEQRLATYRGSRHDTLVEVACWAMREAAAGLYTADAAVDVLDTWWRRVMDDPRRLDSGEFGSAIMWAVAQARSEPERVAEIARQAAHVSPAAPQPADVDPETGEIARSDWRNLPEEFWTASERLEHIRTAAHSRTRSADAVLLFTLARISALVPHTVKLPAIVGGQASLNFLGGVISQSGGGKTTAGDVAAELVPIDRVDVVADVPPGSGEGLTELYFEMVSEEGPDGKNRKVKRQTKYGALIYLDEGQALSEMGSRKGATLLPTLRSAWSGAVIGQSNASTETHRVLKAHTYRMAIMVGFQLEYASGLIDDAAGGTPQRFVFATATDPAVPDTPPEWPGPLQFDIPERIGTGSVVHFDDEIAAEIRRRSLMTTRGEYTPDHLDTHRDLVRMKVAALLAILHDRLNVTVDDWELAGMVMRSSTAVRSWVIETARAVAARDEQAFARKLADRESFIGDTAEDRANVSGAKSIGRKAHKVGGHCTKRDLISAPSSRSKRIGSVEAMLEIAEQNGWIRSDGDGWIPGESRPA